MGTLSKLAGQTAIYGVSSVLARLLNYLLVPYLTRMMTTSEYGVVTDMYALIPFALVLLTMGMETGYFKFAGTAKNVAEKNNIFATTWGAVSLVSVLFIALVALFNNPIAGALGYADNPSYVWVVGTIIAMDAIGAIPFARLREQGKSGRYVILRLVSVVINVALCLFFFGLLPKLAADGTLTALWDEHYKAGYVFVANLVASAITLLLLLPSSNGIWPKIDRKLFRKILLYSLPLLLSGIAGTANEFIDRQMIKYLMPEDLAMSSLGIYGAVVKLAVVMVLFTQMYRLAAEPFFLSGFKKEDFKRTNAEALKFFIAVSVAIFLLITLFTDLFALILGADFREGVFILPIVLLSNMLAGVSLNLSFWFKNTGKTKFALVVTCTGLIFTILLNIALVPKLGYVGAAWARLVCEAVMVVVSYVLNQRHYPTPYNMKRITAYVLVGAVLYALAIFGTAHLPEIPKYIANLLIIIGYTFFVLRVEKIDLRKLIRRKI